MLLRSMTKDSRLHNASSARGGDTPSPLAEGTQDVGGVQMDTTHGPVGRMVVRLGVPTVGRSTSPGTAKTVRSIGKRVNREHLYRPPFSRRHGAG